ncbi:uncharacterized protein G2W53_041167 [Senna tora]|uniref:Uncharacterized protein n=1 Tax=Senna tora TaxID=362788 RepID=A0A834W140_9FABA|nr:uncharacterized protein G2W53_041167 [Senna tora]
MEIQRNPTTVSLAYTRIAKPDLLGRTFVHPGDQGKIMHERNQALKVFAIGYGPSKSVQKELVSEWRQEIQKLIKRLQTKSVEGLQKRWELEEIQKLIKRLQIPEFIKFDWSTDPEDHLSIYYRSMGKWGQNEELLLKYFHHILPGFALKWFTRLDKGIRILPERGSSTLEGIFIK